MKLSGIDFPKSLLDALSNNGLVVFAGAGVSMGKPANLPSFERLAKAISQGTGQAPRDGEPQDRFLGRLKHSGTNVHERAAEELQRTGPKPTKLHHDLLRLFSRPKSVRIVTTNFDSLFEQAAERIFDPNPEVFRAPALPLGSKFNGIVHVHGSIACPEEMILTDEDFGRAYLVESEGWARRFLVELFSSLNILFVGYSHDDTVMNYLARALPASEEAKRFALTDDDSPEGYEWQILGIEPIIYPSHEKSDYSTLYEGISSLVKQVNRGVLDWQNRINEFAKKEPRSLDEEESDLINEALTDVTKIRFFTDVASSPEWIDWLGRKNYLDGLFKNADLCERDAVLANWLTVRFARLHANQLFLLIGYHNTSLNSDLWHILAKYIGFDKNSWGKDTLSRWICLLLATVPAHVHDSVLLSLGERCIEHELFDSIVEIFDAMTTSHLLLRQDIWLGDDIDDLTPPMTAQLELPKSHYEINNLWENGLKLNLDRVVEPLLGNVIKYLERQHHTLRVLGGANRNWNPASMDRSAIEPNEQDRDPKSFDTLIDVARDCLEWLALNQPETAAQLCDRLAGAEAPLLRRLAVHTSFIREDLTPDEKIDWLLSNMDLYDTSVHHELFEAVVKTYPDAKPKRRRDVIKAVLAYRYPDEENKNNDTYTAEAHFDWLYALHTVKPKCSSTKESLDKLWNQFPDFHPNEHPEHKIWMEVGVVGPQSPWTVEELLSKPAEEWIEKLLLFEQTKLLELDRQGLIFTIREAVKQDLQWGLVLAEALANEQQWSTDIWSALLNAWSEINIDKDQHQEILQLLCRTELHNKNILPIAKVLCELVKDDSEPCPPNLLSQANRIAKTLWENLGQDEFLSEEWEWPIRALNHPAGILAQFWINSIHSWRNQQAPIPKFLGDEYNSALSVIIQDGSIAGRLGKCILAGRFYFLLTVDEKWTKGNLLPLFEEYLNEDDYNAVWGGFLQWHQLTPDIAELLEHPFLEAVKRIRKDYPHRYQRNRFINAYTTMLVYFTTDPIDTWIPEFFENADEKDKLDFASAVKTHLVHMDEERQKELWERWLKFYWEKRLQGIPPTPLESGEINIMLAWLPHLKGLFPEAVDLAIRIPPKPLGRNFVIDKINETDLWQNYPETVAKLLVYLGNCDLPTYSWYNAKELIDKLFLSNITQELQTQLKELTVHLRLT